MHVMQDRLAIRTHMVRGMLVGAGVREHMVLKDRKKIAAEAQGTVAVA
jgi:hypothetical protein